MTRLDTTVEYRRLDRRQLLRDWGRPAAFMLLLGGAGVLLAGREGRHRAAPADAPAPRPRDWRVDPGATGRLAAAQGAGPVANLGRALAALGGMAAFIRPGESVVLKPNAAWDRAPEQAATTNPELIGELVRLCLAAGASEVVVADVTCHDPGRAFNHSGIAAAVQKAGGRVAHQHNAGFVELDLGGTTLGRWRVLRPLAEADRVINVPIVKHHSLSGATLGMKNWMGAVDGPRSQMHQRIHLAVAELAAALRPTLTVVDATRVLTGGGPTGGSLDLVRHADAIAVATDPVAADAWGGEQLGLEAPRLLHLAIAQRLGLGSPDWRTLQVEA